MNKQSNKQRLTQYKPKDLGEWGFIDLENDGADVVREMMRVIKDKVKYINEHGMKVK